MMMMISSCFYIGSIYSHFYCERGTSILRPFEVLILVYIEYAILIIGYLHYSPILGVYRLPPSISNKEKEELVETTIQELELSKVADR